MIAVIEQLQLGNITNAAEVVNPWFLKHMTFSLKDYSPMKLDRS